jgi:hypothetical protein
MSTFQEEAVSWVTNEELEGTAQQACASFWHNEAGIFKQNGCQCW